MGGTRVECLRFTDTGIVGQGRHVMYSGVDFLMWCKLNCKINMYMNIYCIYEYYCRMIWNSKWSLVLGGKYVKLLALACGTKTALVRCACFLVYTIRRGGWVVAQVRNIPVYFAHMLDATQHMLCSRNMQNPWKSWPAILLKSTSLGLQWRFPGRRVVFARFTLPGKRTTRFQLNIIDKHV